MSYERERFGVKYYLVETIISLVFLLLIVLLKLFNEISERTFLIGVIIWALITPSPHRWAIVLGDWLRAKKNGGINIQIGNADNNSSNTKYDEGNSETGGNTSPKAELEGI